MAGTVLLVDECFLALSGGDKDSLIHRIRSESLPAVVLRAFTKTFAIPGVRLGYAVCSSFPAAKIRRELPEWNLSVFAQYAGRAALEAAAFGPETAPKAAGQGNSDSGLPGLPRADRRVLPDSGANPPGEHGASSVLEKH